jgi:hypothetical protein
VAQVKMNPVFMQVKGKVGDLVFKQYGEALVMARMPQANGHEVTPAQAAVRERFREAALYGRMALAQPAVRQAYAAAAQEQGKPVTSLMIADFFHAPVVVRLEVSEYTGQAGQSIVAQAHDDFEVTGVTVSIKEAGGQVVESGAADQNPPDSGRWVYTTKQAVASLTGTTITATASDRPGNVGVKTAVK